MTPEREEHIVRRIRNLIESGEFRITHLRVLSSQTLMLIHVHEAWNVNVTLDGLGDDMRGDPPIELYEALLIELDKHYTHEMLDAINRRKP